jgi:hypothetical protein
MNPAQPRQAAGATTCADIIPDPLSGVPE